eukprot:scaffold567022_cov50-Prasinocladus_malaysianus.AAC.1
MLAESFRVESPNVQYGEDSIRSKYQYSTTEVSRDQSSGNFVVRPLQQTVEFEVDCKVPKL